MKSTILHQQADTRILLHKVVARAHTHYGSYQNTPTDPMHLIKNVAEHVVRLISGAEDSFKVRMEEKGRKRFRKAWVKPGSTTLPTAPFRLSTEDKAIANRRAQKINVPIGFVWKPRNFFQKKAVGVKSHEWKQIVSSGILKFYIQGASWSKSESNYL